MAQNAIPHRREPGGVIAEDNNLYGTGVNVVARLEQLAVLGGICVSQTVYDQVRKIVGIPFQDIGARRLKNTGPNGQDVATLEVDYYPGVTPKLGKWNFDIATYYVAYPAPSIQTATLTISSCGVAFRAACSTTSWKSNYNYWSPDYFGETGNNDVLEFSYAWTFGKVGHITPKLAGNFGHQWGTLSEGGYDYTYWSVVLKLGFNENPPLELEIRYWDSFDVRGFTCPPSGVDVCNNLVVGSLKATF